MSEAQVLCVRVVNKKGLHARAAAKLATTAERFTSELSVTRGDFTVEARSIMGLMMLAASQNSEILISATGEDAEQALTALARLVASGFEEGYD
ncbi:MAG: HPr family phosphocarrier protein [Geminicoccaceae bacterium]